MRKGGICRDMPDASDKPGTRPCVPSHVRRHRGVWFIAAEWPEYYISYADIHTYHFPDMIFLYFIRHHFPLASLQHVFFSGRHQPPHNPHKFAHLDYTALDNIPITDPRRVPLHNPTADRWHLVPDSWLFDSQCPCLRPPPPLSQHIPSFWYVNCVVSWRYWSGNHVILGGLRVAILYGRNAIGLHSGGVRFESRPGHPLSWLRFFSWFSSVPPSKYWDTISIRLRSLPSKSFPIHHSSLHLTLHSLDTVGAVR
jgi:hypothetical protein